MLKTVSWNLVYDGVNLSVDYRKPFDVLAEYASCSEWRPQRDLNPCCQIENLES